MDSLSVGPVQYSSLEADEFDDGNSADDIDEVEEAPETSRTTGVPPEGSLKQQICQGRFEAWVSQMKLGHNPLVYELYKRLELLSHSVTNSSVRCLLVEFSIAGMHGVYKQSSCFDPTSPTWLLNSESNKMEQIPNLVVDWTLDDELLISSRYYTGAERRGPYVDESRLSERFGSDTIRALGGGKADWTGLETGLNRLLQFLGLICADAGAPEAYTRHLPFGGIPHRILAA
ncbi:unnamed protein product [Durusdinium trenchii]|uniref:Uncharacterized protein n=1 Tax=Durusdinium trenchii TaxID=1381693 RepID=A0ABP0LZZ1_9DINO